MIEINGVWYKPKSKPNNFNKLYTTLAIMSVYSGGMFLNKRSKTKINSEIDLIKEYSLILDKKSNLSRSERKYIEIEFNKNFEKVMTKASNFNITLLEGQKVMRFLDKRVFTLFIPSPDLGLYKSYLKLKEIGYVNPESLYIEKNLVDLNPNRFKVL